MIPKSLDNSPTLVMRLCLSGSVQKIKMENRRRGTKSKGFVVDSFGICNHTHPPQFIEEQTVREMLCMAFSNVLDGSAARCGCKPPDALCGREQGICRKLVYESGVVARSFGSRASFRAQLLDPSIWVAPLAWQRFAQLSS